MEQHPIPQQISAFKFKLVGALTLRQFGFLAGGLLLAWIFFASPLHPVIKLPIAGFFALGAVLLAFVPMEGRTFDKWLVAFFKAIFNPTQRLWIKKNPLPSIFKPGPIAQQKPPEPIPNEAFGKKKLEEYLKKLPHEEKAPQDVAEERFLKGLDFELGGPVTPPKIPAQVAPSVTAPWQEKPQTTKELIQPTAIPPRVQKEETLPGLEKRIAKEIVPPPARKVGRPQKAPKPVTQVAGEINFSLEPVIVLPKPDGKTALLAGLGQTKVRRLHPYMADFSLPVQGERKFELSEELKRRVGEVDQRPKSKPKTKKAEAVPRPQVVQRTTVKKEVKLKEKPQTAPKQVAPKQTSPSKAPTIQVPNLYQSQKMPVLTDKPNTISGVVIDQSGVLLEGAVIVIKDEREMPVRAFKTNPLGQFLSTTPLSEGKYTIETEKEGCNFDIIPFEARGEVIPAVGIKAR